uniref:NADH-ubiquinone oxidoreductase chain 4L n=1 Tax=Spisula sachalinensis TaxID=81899 RepID=A0A2H4U914_SPISA|nr:NADH dehydrogenase subunit 4L [Pseudocardium sachalinense]
MCLIMSVLVFVFSASFLSRHLPHFLSVILIFELITMGVFLLSGYCFSHSTNSFGCYICFIILAFSVAEAVLGLALLVSCSRGVALTAVKAYSFMGV